MEKGRRERRNRRSSEERSKCLVTEKGERERKREKETSKECETCSFG